MPVMSTSVQPIACGTASDDVIDFTICRRTPRSGILCTRPSRRPPPQLEVARATSASLLVPSGPDASTSARSTPNSRAMRRTDGFAKTCRSPPDAPSPGMLTPGGGSGSPEDTASTWCSGYTSSTRRATGSSSSWTPAPGRAPPRDDDPWLLRGRRATDDVRAP